MELAACNYTLDLYIMQESRFCSKKQYIFPKYVLKYNTNEQKLANTKIFSLPAQAKKVTLNDF